MTKNKKISIKRTIFIGRVIAPMGLCLFLDQLGSAMSFDDENKKVSNELKKLLNNPRELTHIEYWAKRAEGNGNAFDIYHRMYVPGNTESYVEYLCRWVYKGNGKSEVKDSVQIPQALYLFNCQNYFVEKLVTLLNA